MALEFQSSQWKYSSETENSQKQKLLFVATQNKTFLVNIQYKK